MDSVKADGTAISAADVTRNTLDLAISDLISGIPFEDMLSDHKYKVLPEVFYGRLLSTLKRRTCREADKGKQWFVPTAAVALENNGITLIVNLDFFDKFDRQSRMAIIKHEAQHVAHRHLFRFKEGKYKNMRRGNIAMDAVINQFNPLINNMVETATGEKFEPVDYKKFPKGGNEPDHSWEWYHEFLESEEEDKNGDGEQGGGEGGNGQDEDGITRTAYGDVFDDHSFFGKQDETTNPEFVEDKLKNDIQKIARGLKPGTAPHEVETILDEIRKESKIPWQVILRNWMKQSLNYTRDIHILRESISVAGVFPGYKRVPLPEFHVYADMSGSIADQQATAFFTEVLNIQSKMRATIHLHQFDTMIHHSEKIEKQFPNIVRRACGGTNFDCIVTHARENKIRNIIIMTDGYAPTTDISGLNVLWAYTTNHQAHDGKKSIVIENS